MKVKIECIDEGFKSDLQRFLAASFDHIQERLVMTVNNEENVMEEIAHHEANLNKATNRLHQLRGEIYCVRMQKYSLEDTLKKLKGPQGVEP